MGYNIHQPHPNRRTGGDRSTHRNSAKAIAITARDEQLHKRKRLLCTAMLGAVLLLGSAYYVKAAAPETPAAPASSPASTTAPANAAAEQPPEQQETVKTDQGELLPEYQDDRSTPQSLISSYYNAINRKEYARAYGYYSEEAREPDFKTYSEGYAQTQSVKIKLGETAPDPGAGQIYWTLPLAIEASLNDGNKQVYTGCYTIRMSNPAMQEVPPFKPMAIMTGTLSKSPASLEDSVPQECEAP